MKKDERGLNRMKEDEKEYKKLNIINIIRITNII